MKILIGLIIIILLIVLSFGFYLVYTKVLLPSNIYYDRVIRIDGNHISLNSGKVVMLAGVYIPRANDANYRKEMEEYINKILLGKDVKIKAVLRKKTRYPKFDLVNIYLADNALVNKKILEEGMGFFDQGYYNGKRLYEKLETYAKNNSIGIWKNKENLVVLYVSSKDWWSFHYPECPEVKKLKPNKRIDFYFFPSSIFFYRDPADCKYCKEIEVKFHRPKLFTYDGQDYAKDVKEETRKYQEAQYK